MGILLALLSLLGLGALIGGGSDDDGTDMDRPDLPDTLDDPMPTDGDDRVVLGSADDIFDGGLGDDTMLGDLGLDRLFGGAGNDILDGGTGNDTLTGGGGRDTFIFQDGRDVIMDFADNVDQITLNGAALGDADMTVAEVIAMGRVVGGDAVFDFGAGDVLTLEGFTDLQALGNDMIIV